MLREVIFDLETKKLFSDIQGNDPGRLGVSIVSLYIRELDNNLVENNSKLISFWEKDFTRMWPFFQQADRIIGFNSLSFDVPALRFHAPFPFAKLKHFDIMQKTRELIGRRISLNSFAKDTLGRKKIDVGTNAVYYWQKGDKKSLTKLKKYCEEDVIITKEIYDFGKKEGHLKYKDKWNTPRKVEVDFSYPKSLTRQESLF